MPDYSRGGEEARIERRQIERVERVLEAQPELGVALDQKPPSKKERVGILGTARELQEIPGRGRNHDVRRAAPAERTKPSVPDGVIGEYPSIGHPQPHAPVRKRPEEDRGAIVAVRPLK